ncbi:MAG TPA: SPOR domain-containing protein, partial [Acidobacteriaceae bacterium]|nr:SPOR domain-containing protein [Acidobacteriaceae bacterium]
ESMRSEAEAPPSMLANEDETSPPSAGMRMILVALGVVVLALIGWRMIRGSRPAQSTVQQAAPVAAQAASAQPAAASFAQKPSAMAGNVLNSAADGASVASASTGAHVEWRVIAFTYNHEDQAKTKVERLAARHPELKPEVFTPNGLAPYLVSIGGAMSREDAYALARKARGEGVAGDVYAQNFHVTGSAQQ